jgi:hypothetical protein
MDALKFKTETEIALKKLQFIKSVIIQIQDNIVSGEATINADCFINIYYNQIKFSLSFSVIFNKSRTWAFDHDNRIGWHRHPLYNVKVHEIVDEPTILEIIKEIEFIINKILTE